jgi:tetratricopeptide (TPR) repeat protein
VYQLATVTYLLEQLSQLVGELLALAAVVVVALAFLVATIGRALKWTVSRSEWLKGFWFARPLLQPSIQISAFDDSAMSTRIGAVLASITQARVGGGREAGMHLYLVTGEAPSDPSFEALRTLPQARTLAAALEALMRAIGRPRLIVSGALLPIGDGGQAALTLTIQLNAGCVASGDFWPSEPPTATLSVEDGYRVLAVTAAAWIEHHVVSQSPGTPAGEVFYSTDARSWALFRAGAELQRMSCTAQADDAYEQALALDGANVGPLVDLANLRRRDGDRQGALALCERAIDLIAQFERRRDGSVAHNPDWYRAGLVHATVYSTWPGELNHPRAERARQAYALARALAAQAAVTRSHVNPIAQFGSGAVGALPAKAQNTVKTADALGELIQLLASTLEPGALLLMAANSAKLRPETFSREAAEAFDRYRGDRDGLRARIYEQLGQPGNDELEPAELVTYVKLQEVVSPRVDYNLACLHGRIATSVHGELESQADPGERDRGAQLLEQELDNSMEYLRRGICRLPPLERPGLLEYAKQDPDLALLLDERETAVQSLSELLTPR